MGVRLPLGVSITLPLGIREVSVVELFVRFFFSKPSRRGMKDLRHAGVLELSALGFVYELFDDLPWATAMELSVDLIAQGEPLLVTHMFAVPLDLSAKLGNLLAGLPVTSLSSPSSL
ncbi:hypothetical protein MRX96_020307 [Rhipicephalus microplus]